MINFGIDLGTTNSAIAKFEKGKVEIFRNPINLRQTLPSVVAFRKKRIIVGDKAREYLQKDPKNVVGSFKRKMGTTETYPIASLGENKTPIELSAYVLKELKNFIHSGEKIEAAVITIPASFDTIQSNATKKAGYGAGFEEVVLLQEPIAASLAYANKDEDAFEEGQWLVYDLGGGTFDVALVKIQDGEMKVVDHEGDNFLGGTDFDKLIVEKLVVPYLEGEGTFEDLDKNLKSASGRHNKLYNILLHKAEEAKIQLSNSQIAEIEFETEDDEGEEIEGYLEIERADFEALLQPCIADTITRIRTIIQRNQLTPNDLKFVLMVGGSTYIPYVRTAIAKALKIEVNCNIDPTTAVAVGAAFYAGTKPLKSQFRPSQTPENAIASNLQIKTAYQKTSQEEEEYFTALIEGDTTNLFYRMTRSDGGFDTGLKALEERIFEMLTLAPNTFNVFDLQVFDAKNNRIAAHVAPIGITQGKYSVVGQPLPNDICLEIDDLENGATALEVIFEKNSILPTKRTIIKEVTKTIRKGSEHQITINIVEGPAYAMPSANQTIGFISISGKELERDLVKGSDIEITLEMSESRDLYINTYLMLTDQEYEDTFTPSERHVNVSRLSEEIMVLYGNSNDEIRDAESREDYETAGKLKDIKKAFRSLAMRVKELSEDDVTDEKFQIDAQKRELAQQMDNLIRDKHIIAVKMDYMKAKRWLKEAVEANNPNPTELQTYEDLLAKERSILATNNRLKIQELANKLYDLRGTIMWRDPAYVKTLFYIAQMRSDEFSNPTQGQSLIKAGEDALQHENYDKLRVTVNALFGLLPSAGKGFVERGGTGIG